ncbi:MAG: TatD family hydrolase [Firmicutes bacterium]|nr:TatD family hydrolase [Bacillota bacterium]
MNWVDSHAHLNDTAFENDLERVIDNALEAGVKAILVPGFDLDSSVKAVELAKYYPMIWAAVGIHPHDAKTWNQAVVNHWENLLVEPKVIAVGEIGLDYHYNYSTKEEQLKAFIEQINIAKQCNKPIIIHNREAHQDTFEVLTKEKVGGCGGVMHCFSGSKEMVAEFLRLGLYISFAGPLTFTNAVKLREAAKAVPLDKLLVETDSPYLAPHPLRGRRNEPANVRLVGERLAETLNQPVEVVAGHTSTNASNLFGITF